ncbi:BgTH12-07005 [Blumeria graminis f. sp. triticale]|nr:BgTH12-07005 [Blumeria graminis f. sp. triticale]
MPVETELYDLLGISPTATQAEIKKAYHRAALLHHPDKVSEDQRQESEQKFKEVSSAYEILYDEEKRHLYNSHGMAAFDPSRGGPNMDSEVDLEDIFSHVFNLDGRSSPFRGPGGTHRSGKGPNEEQKYQVSLEDLYKGKTVKFSSKKNIICSNCKGSGGKERAKPVNCDKCKGKGFVVGLRSVGPGMVTQERMVCGNCSGSGTLFKEKDRCKKCKGKRTTMEKKVLEIYIPRGSREKEKIVLEGEADQVPNQEPGDIVFTLVQDPHEVFQRSGNDLSAEVHITLAESLTGFNRVVLKHLDNRGIQICHPRGKIMRPEQVIKIVGEGMPIKKTDAKGDLFLTVKIDFPSDKWASNPATLTSIEKLFSPLQAPVIEANEVDEVEFESDADISSFGAQAGEQGWVSVDEDEEDEEGGGGVQCAQQ